MSQFLNLYRSANSNDKAVQASAICLACQYGFTFSAQDCFEDIILDIAQFAYKSMSPEDKFAVEMDESNVITD
jgi:hypothetical protein